MLLHFLIGLLTGVLSGFGIGGGSLLILYMTSFTEVNQYAAGGINLLYFLFCAPAALVSHIKNKLVEKKAVLICTLAGIPSSLLAAWGAAVIDISLLRRSLRGVFAVYRGEGAVLQKAGAGKGRGIKDASTGGESCP